MNYVMKKATKDDIPKLVDYKLKSILDYANDLTEEEKNNIENYVISHVPKEICNYKIICVNNKKIGSLLIEPKDDGFLINEIYLEKDYRNKGIGTDILNNVIEHHDILYLYVYKLNTKAVSLYRRLGFKVIDETESRYYMKYSKFINKTNNS